MDYDSIKSPADLFEWALHHKGFSCNKSQVIFARELFNGAEQTEAAKRAGWKGSGIRVQASRARHNKRVIQLLEAAAELAGEGDDGDLLSLSDEILDTFKKEMRFGNTSADRVRAADLLGKHEALRRAGGRPGSWPEMLTALCGHDRNAMPPMLTATAILLAAADNGAEDSAAWRPPAKSLAPLRGYPELLEFVRSHGGERVERYLRTEEAGASSQGTGATVRTRGDGTEKPTTGPT